MQLSINPPTWLWFLPNSIVHLTDENPGPIDIDFGSLSKENQKLVIIGVRNKQIVCSETEPKLLAIYNPQQSIIQHTKSTPNVDEGASTVVSEEEIKKIASNKLNLTLLNIKKFTLSNDNIRLLRTMLELEKDTRNRKSVINNIQLKLDTLISQIHSSIEKENTSIVAILPDPLADQLDIVDSEVEERSVELER